MNYKEQYSIVSIRAHQRHVVTCMLLDDERVITASDDMTICSHNTKTGQLVQQFNGHTGGVWSIDRIGNLLVSGSTDTTARVWDLERGECIHVFTGHSSTVRQVKIINPTVASQSADESSATVFRRPLVVTGSRDATMRVWKLPLQQGDQPFGDHMQPPSIEGESPYFIRSLIGHASTVRSIDAHGDVVVSGSYDKTVRAWKISTGEVLHIFDGHAEKVYAVVLDHSRNRCISGSMDKLVKIWCLESGTCLFTLEGHTSLVGLLALNHQHLVSGSADGSLRIWDPETGKNTQVIPGQDGGAVTCFQHDGSKAIVGRDKTLTVWDIETGECKGEALTGLSGVWQVIFDEKQCVAAVMRDGETYIEVISFEGTSDLFAGDQSRG